MKDTDVINNIKRIYDMFEDKLSKELYVDRLNWLISGEYKYVEDIVKKSHSGIPVWNRKKEEDFIELLPQDKKVVFYGVGTFAVRLLPYLEGRNIDILFCDSDEARQKEGFEGYKIISPIELFQMKKPKKIVICTTKYYNEIKKYLEDNGILQDEIIDIRAYFKCGTGDDYFYENFLKYEEKEIFVDAGCYNLATTKDFKKKCKGLIKSYAFEPDDYNYQQCYNVLNEEKESLPNVQLYPYGTWSCETTLCFDASSDGCSHIGEGSNEIKTIAIDDVVGKRDKITFIKMDVEGAELESLKGAKEIIKRDSPKLAICIYHKPEDIITIPLYIKELVPQYKFYLRSYSNADNEMVLYAVL